MRVNAGRLLRATLIAALLLIAGGVFAVSPAGATSPPIVVSVSPNVGLAFTPVTITGTGFTDATAVEFGGIPSPDIAVVSDTYLSAVVPSGSGTVDVTVTTPEGTSAISFEDQFTYEPVVYGISPSEGPAGGGTAVTITGTGFTGATAVQFDGTPASSMAVNNEDSITAISPPGTGTGDITVTTPGGTSSTSPADQFTYLPIPAVTAVSPDSGPTVGGTTVTVTGTGFTGVTAVQFGADAATIIVNTATFIEATSPAASAGTDDVIVTTPGGTSSTSPADHFNYVNSPAVTAISPASGPTVGGTTVTIAGTDLSDATAVDFGTTPAASFTVNSDTSITATTPVGSAGTDDVKVTTPYGTSATDSADEFTYSAPSSGTGTQTTGTQTTGTQTTSTPPPSTQTSTLPTSTQPTSPSPPSTQTTSTPSGTVSIAYKLSSSAAKSRSGWWHTPVTVTFHCGKSSGATLTFTCPAPVTLAKSRRGQTVSRTITASDGATATVTTPSINIDRTAPLVRITGPKSDASYELRSPTARCQAVEEVSGIITCKLTFARAATTSGYRETIIAVATSGAGTSATARTSFTVASTIAPAISGFKPAAAGDYTVPLGHAYKLIVVSNTRPTYVFGAPTTGAPSGGNVPFEHDGTVDGVSRWSFTTTLPTALADFPTWNIGIRVGTELDVLTIKTHR